jgi:hypothetical protein
MSESGGLIYAVRLDGRGGGEPLDWEQIRAASPQAARPGCTLACPRSTTGGGKR